MAGNFDVTMPTKAQESALQALLEVLSEKYNIPNKNIVPHRKFTAKTCYGMKLPDDWAASLLVAGTGKEQMLKLLDTLRELILQN